MTNTQIAYKGFHPGYVCNGFQYEPGNLYKTREKILCGGCGFHACLDPRDVLKFYPPGTSVYGLVEQSDKISNAFNDWCDTAYASSQIEVLQQFNLREFLNEIYKYVKERQETSADQKTDARTISLEGYTCTLYRDAEQKIVSIMRDGLICAAYNDRSVMTTEDCNALSAVYGSYSIARCTGSDSIAAAYSNSGVAVTEQCASVAIAEYSSSCAMTLRHSSIAICGGSGSLAECHGHSSAAVCINDGTATVSGDFSAAIAYEDACKAACEGTHSIAAVLKEEGYASAGRGGTAVAIVNKTIHKYRRSKLRAKSGGAIVFIVTDDDDNVVDVKTGIAGADIEPNIYYIYDNGTLQRASDTDIRQDGQ
jgi:hypothetical protein